MRRAFSISVLIVLVLSLFGGSAVLAADRSTTSRPVPSAIDGLKLDRPITTTGVNRPTTLDASLLSATGVRQVVVRLTNPSAGEVAADGATPAAQRAARSAATAQQDRLLATTDARLIARTNIATNTVVLQISDVAQLDALARDPNVVSISPVIDYELALDDTVPYIGAAALHAEDPAITGAGVTVAVLDSGIDYTHDAFQGGYANYISQYGTSTTSQVNKDRPNWAAIGAATHIVGGFDFVGEAWPLSDVLSPDADPIGCGGMPIGPGPDLCDGGHGTHVADIIGGTKGVAPDVSMYAVKVCSAVASSCSGVALLLGMDFALDPNGDGDLSDRVDLINMSLGSPYGQWMDDDLSIAVEVATANGTLTVASAGNSSDKPYVTGSPAAAPSALSVAQTAVPTEVLPLLTVIAPEGMGPYASAFQPWSHAIDAVVSGDLQYGDGAGGNLDGCAAFDPGSLDGLVVLVNRGTCNFSLKISNVAAAGAVLGIIGLINADAPFAGGLGDCPADWCSAIPGLMISQADSNALKSALGAGTVTVGVDPAIGLPLVGTMVGSSSRGPTMITNAIKPEIGAPGASISAEAGTDNEVTPFGGTSGAAPMVTGSAALLLSQFPDRSPAEIKSLLMNYAETEIYNGAPGAPISAPLAAIQRIGAGEVRVDDSYFGSDMAAWDTDAGTAALSFGFVDASEAMTVLTRNVTVHNYGGAEQTLEITPGFRFEDDEANGAVDVSAPDTVVVPAGGDASFDVTLTIDGAALRAWTANSGGLGNNALPFTELEYDGYITLSGEGVGPLHLAWFVLPRQSGDVSASNDSVTITGEFEGSPAGSVTLNNAGVGFGGVDGYSLVGVSPQLPATDEGDNLPDIDLQYAGVQTIPVGAGFCSEADSFLLLFAVHTWDRQTHANAPAAFEWDLDIDSDGEADYAVYNLDVAGDLSDGRNAVYALDLDTDMASIWFLTDHGTNSGNTVLTVCAEQIGLTGADFGRPITADLFAVDTYFTGTSRDMISGIEFAPLGERYFPVIGDDGFGSGDVEPGGSATLHVMDFGAAGTNPSETGVLLFTDGARGGGIRAGAPQDSEAIALTVNGLPFADIGDSAFVDDIVWAYENGITDGCAYLLFCPYGNVTREQMASFLVRALDLPATETDFFTDDESSMHEADINALAEAGITNGCTATTFCPTQNVKRDQMATFLVRAFDLPPTATDHFTDDTGNFHEANINALAEAGITNGCTATTFCPSQTVSRGQMAAFLHRAMGD